jgi:hypothetical protein
MRVLFDTRQWLLGSLGLIAGAAVGAAIVYASATARPASAEPVAIAVTAFCALAIFLATPRPARPRATQFIALAGVGLVVSITVLSAFGVGKASDDPVALVAALAALVTLVLVQQQIILAREQIDVANEQLRVALSEIKLVENDLAYSKEQSNYNRELAQERERRPRLGLTWSDGRSRKELSPTRGAHQLSAEVLIHNGGERTSRDALVEMLVPWSVFRHDFSDEQLESRDDTWVRNGVPHRRFERQVAEPIYRDVAKRVSVFSETLILDPASFEILWRLRDDFGAYPTDGSWDALQVYTLEPPADQSRRRYVKRSFVGSQPALAWDRARGDAFVYASFTPEESEEVVVIDEPLQRRIEELVHSLPGLGNTTATAGQVAIEFTKGEPARPLIGADANEIARTQAYEKGRHRCYVRADGMVEVRLPQDGESRLYQVLRALGCAYALASALHADLRTQPRAHGRLVYLFGNETDGVIGTEDDRFIEATLSRDEFVDLVAPIVMEAQRAADKPPVEAEVASVVRGVWARFLGKTRLPDKPLRFDRPL